MIRIAAHPKSGQVPAWHASFLAMLPTIVRYARMAFRNWPPEAREDAMQEVIANCLVAFARLAELNKTDIAYPTVLARYAVAQVKEGRRVGSRHTIRDVLSPYCQREKHITVERLDGYDPEEGHGHDQGLRRLLLPRRQPVHRTGPRPANRRAADG